MKKCSEVWTWHYTHLNLSTVPRKKNQTKPKNHKNLNTKQKNPQTTKSLNQQGKMKESKITKSGEVHSSVAVLWLKRQNTSLLNEHIGNIWEH